MTVRDHIVEFEAVVERDGVIRVPVHALERLHGVSGGRFSVRVSSFALTAKLESRGVTEEEIQRIADVQRESREQVVKFLLSEGALHGRRKTGLSRRGST